MNGLFPCLVSYYMYSFKALFCDKRPDLSKSRGRGQGKVNYHRLTGGGFDSFRACPPRQLSKQTNEGGYPVCPVHTNTPVALTLCSSVNIRELGWVKDEEGQGRSVECAGGRSRRCSLVQCTNSDSKIVFISEIDTDFCSTSAVSCHENSSDGRYRAVSSAVFRVRQSSVQRR